MGIEGNSVVGSQRRFGAHPAPLPGGEQTPHQLLLRAPRDRYTPRSPAFPQHRVLLCASQGGFGRLGVGELDKSVGEGFTFWIEEDMDGGEGWGVREEGADEGGCYVLCAHVYWLVNT